MFRARIGREPVVLGVDRRYSPRTHNRKVGYTMDIGGIVVSFCPQTYGPFRHLTNPDRIVFFAMVYFVRS